MAADSVSISSAAEAWLQASEAGGIRQDVVSRIKGEIAAGTYETSAKLDAALIGFRRDGLDRPRRPQGAVGEDDLFLADGGEMDRRAATHRVPFRAVDPTLVTC